ncbi:MAG: CHY zinc finger protein [Ferruginibacter sp.]
MVVKGNPIDEQTRCKHYHTEQDIIAIKFRCCNEYYPCYNCHEELAGHLPEVWNKTEFDTKAILCGVCKNEMSIIVYKECNYKCPFCSASFNPKCRNHDHLYFEE